MNSVDEFCWSPLFENAFILRRSRVDFLPYISWNCLLYEVASTNKYIFQEKAKVI